MITDSEILYQRFSKEIIDPLLYSIDFHTVLDAGCGAGLQTEYFIQKEKDCLGVDLLEPKVDIPFSKQSIYDLKLDKQYDLIWSHHVIEHLRDPITALNCLKKVTKLNGYAAITVPQINNIISPGHINSYSLPLIMYHLAAAGWDCSSGFFTKARSHLRCIVRKTDENESISNEFKDIMQYFPKDVKMEIEKTGRFTGNETYVKWIDGKKQLLNMVEYREKKNIETIH